MNATSRPSAFPRMDGGYDLTTAHTDADGVVRHVDREALDAMDARAASYGVQLDGPFSTADNAELRESVDHSIRVYWNDPELARVLVLRLIGANREYPFWDVSYCYGELKDGTRVRVDLPFFSAPDLPMRTWKRAVIEFAKRDGVYAKGLGILDNVSMLRG